MNKKTLFIFDWDDTLFPTHWFVTNDIKIDKEIDAGRYILYFTELDAQIYRLLKLASDMGTVLIVTNAVKHWINIATRLLPKTATLIKERVTIFSARDLYRDKYEMKDWKIQTFNNELADYVEMAKQIISIGDSDLEHNALISLLNITTINLKAIRLVATPTYDILIDQINMLTKSLPEICSLQQHLDIQFKSNISNVDGFMECISQQAQAFPIQFEEVNDEIWFAK